METLGSSFFLFRLALNQRHKHEMAQLPKLKRIFVHVHVFESAQLFVVVPCGTNGHYFERSPQRITCMFVDMVNHGCAL